VGIGMRAIREAMTSSAAAKLEKVAEMANHDFDAQDLAPRSPSR
jgi:hypothetical protein